MLEYKLQFLFSDMDVLQTEIKLKTDKLKTIQDQFGFMESGLLKQKDRYACGLLTNHRDMLGNTLQEQDQGHICLCRISCICFMRKFGLRLVIAYTEYDFVYF